jgi:DNA-binding HxlR family transcriptional regulator
VLKREYETQRCPIAASLEVVGERWTLLILRDAFMGIRRFEAFQQSLGVARNVLQTRLTRLVEEGVLNREQYSERPPRYEYRLTDKGLELWPVLVALLQWGTRYVLAGEKILVLEHNGCGGELDDRRKCVRCGAELGPRDVQARPMHHLEPRQDGTVAEVSA